MQLSIHPMQPQRVLFMRGLRCGYRYPQGCLRMLSETRTGHGGASQMLRAGFSEILQPASGKLNQCVPSLLPVSSIPFPSFRKHRYQSLCKRWIFISDVLWQLRGGMWEVYVGIPARWMGKFELRAAAAGFLQTQAELLTLNVLIWTFDKLSSPSHFS